MGKLVWILLSSLFIGASSDAGATSTKAPMRECANCTATQMQTMAKNSPVGYAFIYDLSHNVIREYEAYMDSTCGPEFVPQPGTGARGIRAIQDTGPGVDCGSFKAADEITPVDADAQAIFNSLHSAWAANPTLANTATSEVTNMPIDGNHRYDAPKIAWDYPQGEFLAFEGYLWNKVLNNRANANAFSEGLGDIIFGVDIAVNSVTIGTPPDVLTVQITTDRQLATIHLKVCDTNLVCVNFTIKVVQAQVDSLTYTGTYDSNNMMLPSESGQTPGQLNAWHWHQGADGDGFANYLHNNSGIAIPVRSGCGASFDYKLIVARVNGQIDSATWMCTPQN